MKFGYARVSTLEQNLQLQKDALEKAGCEKIFTDKISGAYSERPGLTQCKEILRKGDVLVVWRLDRLGRSLKDLIHLVNELEDTGIEFQSLTESINTKTSTGKLIFHVFAMLAEFERNLISDRTKAGIKAARARGRKGGRPCKLPLLKTQLLYQLYDERKLSINEICETIGISRPTLYSYMKKRNPAQK